ncbi:hypothetical protein Kpho02_37470 [Kitasatospora phosalacinea]|uniref:Uncharacterized protein n=1 Tax=Kitasatospora phosalacinea TaxID=2065 RepID=A0A9W6V2P2_9ACTN|nr:hypothetical protein [Kitasatospora phosalacinea]GLW71448.1 hypothetical protein Kpho02_37470 [Kitasatospora phosalacinea]
MDTYGVVVTGRFPAPAALAPDDGGAGRGGPDLRYEDLRYEPDLQERRAMARARGAGERAAAWVRALAGRQPERSHGRTLLRTAAALEAASGAAVVPGGDGSALDGGSRYHLLASWAIGPVYHYGRDARTLPELTGAERLALVAACALAAAMPGTVGGDFAPELDVLAAALEDAVRAGRGAAPSSPADARPPEAP